MKEKCKVRFLVPNTNVYKKKAATHPPHRYQNRLKSVANNKIMTQFQPVIFNGLASIMAVAFRAKTPSVFLLSKMASSVKFRKTKKIWEQKSLFYVTHRVYI